MGRTKLKQEDSRWWERQKIFMFTVAGTNDPIKGFQYNIEERADLVASTGCNLTQVFVGGGRLGHPVYFKTSLPVDVPEDLLGRMVEAYHKRNIKVCVYINCHAVEHDFAIEHQEFLQHGRGGLPQKIYGHDYPVCPNSPDAVEWFDRMHTDLLAYDIDMIHHDSLAFFPDCCYCEFCGRMFKEQTGKELPPRDELSHPDMPAMLEFFRESVDAWNRHHERFIHGLNANVPFVANLGVARGAHWRLGLNERTAASIVDMVINEIGYKGEMLNSQSLLRTGIGARLVDGQSGGRFFGAMTLVHKPHEYTYLPPAEILLSCAQIAANGGSCWTGTRIAPKKQIDALRTMGTFLRRHDPVYVNTRSLARAAVMWPNHTINFSPQTELAEDDKGKDVKAVESAFHGNPARCFDGAVEALFRNHVPFDVIDEETLSKGDLADRYRVLILANAVCLAERHIEHIRGFVEAGGTLVASHQTSFCDEYGRPRGKPGLEEVFGIRAGGVEIGPRDLEHVGPAKKGGRHAVTEHLQQKHLLSGPDRDMWIPCPPYFLQCELNGGEALLYHSEKARGRSGSGRPPRLDRTPLPALVYNRIGNGQAFYFNGLFFLDYWTQRQGDFLKLMGEIFSDCGCRTVRLENAHQTIEVVLREKQNGTKILHLINCTGHMTRPIDEVIPCHDVRITIDAEDFAPKSVRALWCRKDLPFEKSEDGMVSFVLPRLELYEVIVLEG